MRFDYRSAVGEREHIEVGVECVFSAQGVQMIASRSHRFELHGFVGFSRSVILIRSLSLKVGVWHDGIFNLSFELLTGCVEIIKGYRFQFIFKILLFHVTAESRGLRSERKRSIPLSRFAGKVGYIGIDFKVEESSIMIFTIFFGNDER